MNRVRLAVFVTLITAAASPALSQPPAAILTSPSADVVGTTIAFTWQSAAGATWYHFWLGRPNTSLITEQWYTAEHVGCATGGTCTMTVTPPVGAGPYIWHVRTWGPSGYGAWSPALMFTVKDPAQAWAGKLPPSRRFTRVLDDGGVLDNETGLVWERVPAETHLNWGLAVLGCYFKTIGGRKGWHLPTIRDLESLIDESRARPALPPGHPFELGSITDADLWFHTQTVHPNDAASVLPVSLVNGVFGVTVKSSERRAWCVRGGTGPLQ
jgi:hypothetical protein